MDPPTLKIRLDDEAAASSLLPTQKRESVGRRRAERHLGHKKCLEDCLPEF